MYAHSPRIVSSAALAVLLPLALAMAGTGGVYAAAAQWKPEGCV